MASSYRCGYHALGSATSPHVKTRREFPYPSPCEVARRDRVRAWPDARLIVTLRPQGGFQLVRFKMPFLPVNTMTTAVPWVLTAGEVAVCFARSNCYNPRVPSAITDTEKSHSPPPPILLAIKLRCKFHKLWNSWSKKKCKKKKIYTPGLQGLWITFFSLYKIFSRTTRSVYMTVSNCTIFNKLMLLYIINLHVKNDLLSFHN